jgi:Holliday junction DNA helicase RuvA
VIARLTGRRVAVQDGAVVVDVGGVGYLVHASAAVLRLGEELTVETYMHVREDALQLYGFASAEERELFVHLLSVNGVGPKVALAIVSGSSPAELRRAIALEDTARFEAIPGIGKKTAQRVVLELKEKLGALEPVRAVGAGAVGLQAREALIELGYALLDAERALDGVDPALPVEEQVRQALRRAA